MVESIRIWEDLHYYFRSIEFAYDKALLFSQSYTCQCAPSNTRSLAPAPPDTQSNLPYLHFFLAWLTLTDMRYNSGSFVLISSTYILIVAIDYYCLTYIPHAVLIGEDFCFYISEFPRVWKNLIATCHISCPKWPLRSFRKLLIFK